MERFTAITGTAAPLPLPNIDTDVIMPKQFLKRIDRKGLASGVFHDVRFDEEGEERPDFVLNKDRYKAPTFLIAGRNFGCGSSREHAVWGLMQFGIRAIIAPSFAGIFAGNCEKNGLLTITLPEPTVENLIHEVEVAAQPVLTVDLAACMISTPSKQSLPFEIEAVRRHNLLNGLDHIADTLQYAPDIRAFQSEHVNRMPWLTGAGSGT